MTNLHATKVIVQGPQAGWAAAAWQEVVTETVAALQASAVDAKTVVVTVMDNSPAFIAVDQALEVLGAVHVPLPPFFTAGQIHSILDLVGCECLIQPSSGAQSDLQIDRLEIAGVDLYKRTLTKNSAAIKAHAGTGVITFTSGSTGDPKGVCLSRGHLRAVSEGIREALQPFHIKRHLSALPYGVLLEHVAGVKTAFAQGTAIVSLPLASVGLKGSSQFDPCQFDACLRTYEIESVILLPQMLSAWLQYLEKIGQKAPRCIKFVAVGGAPVGRVLLHRATAFGVPVYEGYGLSEGGSVQTLNLPPERETGSVGKSLPHSHLSLGEDGEIWVRKPVMLGYLGHPPQTDQPFPTGDLGAQTADGAWQIVGRKKNVIVTSYGRNVSPEWLETLLCDHLIIGQVVVIGDAMPRLAAVVWPASPTVTRTQIDEVMTASNKDLPDYAQIANWCLGAVDNDARQNEFTLNGRPKRTYITAKYRPEFESQRSPL